MYTLHVSQVGNRYPENALSILATHGQYLGQGIWLLSDEEINAPAIQELVADLNRERTRCYKCKVDDSQVATLLALVRSRN